MKEKVMGGGEGGKLRGLRVFVARYSERTIRKGSRMEASCDSISPYSSSSSFGLIKFSRWRASHPFLSLSLSLSLSLILGPSSFLLFHSFLSTVRFTWSDLLAARAVLHTYTHTRGAATN